jgi:hypothetical protein
MMHHAPTKEKHSEDATGKYKHVDEVKAAKELILCCKMAQDTLPAK